MASNRELRPFGLETFSLWCAKWFLELHPEWLPFVSAVEAEQGGLPVRTLAINFPSANPNVTDPLILTVDLQRIIAVSWIPTGTTWDWIYYFDNHPEAAQRVSRTDGVDAVAEFVEQVFAEELVAVWTEGSFGWTSPDGIRADHMRRTQVWSWRGTFDQTLEPIP